MNRSVMIVLVVAGAVVSVGAGILVGFTLGQRGQQQVAVASPAGSSFTAPSATTPGTPSPVQPTPNMTPGQPPAGTQPAPGATSASPPNTATNNTGQPMTPGTGRPGMTPRTGQPGAGTSPRTGQPGTTGGAQPGTTGTRQPFTRPAQFTLARLVEHVANLKDGATALTAAQAKTILAAVTPLEKLAKLTADKAKQVTDKVNAVLTADQKTAVEAGGRMFGGGGPSPGAGTSPPAGGGAPGGGGATQGGPGGMPRTGAPGGGGTPNFQPPAADENPFNPTVKSMMTDRLQTALKTLQDIAAGK
jgi:hypothetical protein